MNKTLFLGVLVTSLVIISAAGALQAEDKEPFKAILEAIDELQNQVTVLQDTTTNVQTQVNSIEAELSKLDTVDGNDGQSFAYDAFMKIDSILGESTDEGYEGWINILGYSHEVNPIDHGEFKVTKMVDKASPKLYLHASEGQYIEEVILEVTRPNGVMRYTMSNVVVKKLDKASPKLYVAVGETLPIEEVSFSYGQIQWEYTPIEGSPIQTGWDTVESRPIEQVTFN